MVTSAESVLERLKNVAKQTGRSYQLCLQLFCQEEFLRRLSQSKYAENFVLKGGLFLYVISNFSSRVTMDIDFLLRQIPNTPDKLRVVIEEIISQPSENDFISFEISKVSEISINKIYPGVSVSLIARIKNTKTPFSIDFGFGDIIIPEKEKHSVPVQLEGFEAPEIYTYSIETSIAEKLDAIMFLMDASSRMKDYYDIYYMSKEMSVDKALLSEAIHKIFTNRGHELSIERFDRVIAFKNNNLVLSRWKAFCRKISFDIPFDEVIDEIDAVIRPLI